MRLWTSFGYILVYFGCLYTRISLFRGLFVISFWLVMVDEDHVVSDSTKIWATLCTRGISELGVRQLTNELGNFGTHAMLFLECFVRITLENQPLEQTAIEIKSIAFLNCKPVIVDLRTKLPMRFEVNSSASRK